MSLSPFRCLLALGIACCFYLQPAEADVVWSAAFPSEGEETVFTAFVVGDGRHVVSVALPGASTDGGRLLSDERLLPAEVIHDPVSRLVVFRLSGPPGRAMPLLSEGNLAMGAIVKARGGIEGKCSGRVKQVQGKVLPLTLLKIDYAATVPRPGTPLMDAGGKVVAVAHQALGSNSGYAIPVDVVKRVLDDVQRGGHVSRGWIGLHLRPESAVPRVTRVQEGSPSAMAGVEPGDVLLQVGHRRLDEYADAVNAFFFLRPGVATSVKLKRGDRELTLSITPVESRSD